MHRVSNKKKGESASLYFKFHFRVSTDTDVKFCEDEDQICDVTEMLVKCF